MAQHLHVPGGLTMLIRSPSAGMACGAGLHCYNACAVNGGELESNAILTLRFRPADIMVFEVGAPSVLTGEGAYDAI